MMKNTCEVKNVCPVREEERVFRNEGEGLRTTEAFASVPNYAISLLLRMSP